ncbi:isochorismate synthase [Rhodococcoides kyotonense]|uniref:isochorismate synthase n=1 Tax=Rhodococcoides kyotonense TaxID=398843 RepID=A0A239E116_9NOCA|nr:isochorismate synthase [Rhodococcus kyotonensis]SNS38297.1 isochorismate synthase [Rhodococcus kyotonensis]
MSTQASTTDESTGVGTPPPGEFVLSRPHGTVTASGVRGQFDDAGAAVAALRSGNVAQVAGALPFASDAPCALTWPDRFVSTTQRWVPRRALTPLPNFAIDELREAEHLDRVRTAVEVLRSEHSALQKVVLARTLTLRADASADPDSVLAALVSGTPHGNGYRVDLSAAGGRFVGKTLVGSSPEVLIRKQGSVVTCHPLAGSAPRHTDPRIDDDNGRALAESSKDLREHAFVVDAIRTALAPFCSELDIPDVPTLTTTPQLWHLGTPIRGVLRDPQVTSLELALALHPTPAVCGTPTELAYASIDELEGDRGFYAGAVGWCTADGDGEWMVAIRCAEISSDRRRVDAYAGGGIVAQSDPDAELQETITKFGTVLGALGVQL